MLRRFQFLVLVAIAAVFFAAGSALALEVGETAPDFTLPTLDGNKVSLSDYKGRVILLKLATTWCPTCKQQTETILANDKFLKKNDVVVIEVFVQDSEKMVKEYLKGKTFNMTFAALMDDGQAYRGYNVYLIPRVILIDRDFKVFRDGGQLFADDLRRLIKEI